MSDVIFSFHHIITDGFTSSHICNNFVEVLNDVICGSVKSEYKNFGKFSDSTETDELIKQRIQFFQDNPKEFQKITNEMVDFKNQTVVLNQLFPVPDDVYITTKHLMRDLEERQTILLLKLLQENSLNIMSDDAVSETNAEDFFDYEISTDTATTTSEDSTEIKILKYFAESKSSSLESLRQFPGREI